MTTSINYEEPVFYGTPQEPTEEHIGNPQNPEFCANDSDGNVLVRQAKGEVPAIGDIVLEPPTSDQSINALGAEVDRNISDLMVVLGAINSLSKPDSRLGEQVEIRFKELTQLINAVVMQGQKVRDMETDIKRVLAPLSNPAIRDVFTVEDRLKGLTEESETRRSEIVFWENAIAEEDIFYANEKLACPCGQHGNGTSSDPTAPVVSSQQHIFEIEKNLAQTEREFHDTSLQFVFEKKKLEAVSDAIVGSESFKSEVEATINSLKERVAILADAAARKNIHVANLNRELEDLRTLVSEKLVSAELEHAQRRNEIEQNLAKAKEADASTNLEIRNLVEDYDAARVRVEQLDQAVKTYQRHLLDEKKKLTRLLGFAESTFFSPQKIDALEVYNEDYPTVDQPTKPIKDRRGWHIPLFSE